MTAVDRSLIGYAKQTAKGTPAATGFKYFMFTRGSAGVQNMTIPLDPEVGGGVLLRDVAKVGVTSGGAFEFIPRPDSLGAMIMAMTGKDTKTGDGAATPYAHVFELPTDQYEAPYYTMQFAPGNMWGEQYQDCRFTSLALNWRGANFVRGAVGFIGGLPTPGQTTTGWGASADLDAAPPFITPVATMEMPSASAIKVVAGSFQMTTAIPMEQQWIVGSYSPDDFDIVSRAFVLNLTLKITNSTLYDKMVYDGDGAVSAWAAELYRQSSFNIEFKTAQNMPTVVPAAQYSLKIEGNNGSAPNGNVVWTAQPLGLRSGQQVLMNATGVFLADAATAVKLTLVNNHAATY